MSTHESYTVSRWTCFFGHMKIARGSGVPDSRRRFLAQVPTGATRPGKCDNVSGFGADSRGGWGDFPLPNGTAGIRAAGGRCFPLWVIFVRCCEHVQKLGSPKFPQWVTFFRVDISLYFQWSCELSPYKYIYIYIYTCETWMRLC